MMVRRPGEAAATGSRILVDLEPPLRRARLDDAATLAQLIDLAGEGMPGHLWAEMAQAGETALDVGTQRAAREDDYLAGFRRYQERH